jgi:4-aminobutyrate aminotransferase-like enzyme
LSGGDYKKVLFGCTGFDANEFALKAAKYCKGGSVIISFWRGYHGAIAGFAVATGKAETIQIDPCIASLMPSGFVHLLYHGNIRYLNLLN